MRFLGALLVAAGALIALLSGGCSMFVLALTISELESAPERLAQNAIFLAVGLIPMAIGVGLVWAGLRLMRNR
jgi:hypothetical protein